MKTLNEKKKKKLHSQPRTTTWSQMKKTTEEREVEDVILEEASPKLMAELQTPGVPCVLDGNRHLQRPIIVKFHNSGEKENIRCPRRKVKMEQYLQILEESDS